MAKNEQKMAKKRQKRAKKGKKRVNFNKKEKLSIYRYPLCSCFSV